MGEAERFNGGLNLVGIVANGILLRNTKKQPKAAQWLINTGVLNNLALGGGIWVEAGLLLKSIRKTPYA